MLSKEGNPCLVVGIGNPLRSDDGVGSHIVQKIQEKHIPGVKTLVCQQLNIELLEEVGKYKKILLIDASFLGEGMSLRKVNSAKDDQAVSSHHLTPEFFLMLAKKLYHWNDNLYLCSIRGRSFEMGQQLSPEVQRLVPQAIDEVHALLKES